MGCHSLRAFPDEDRELHQKVRMASSGVGQSLVARTGDAVDDSTSVPVTGSTSVPVTGSTPVPVTDSASVPVTGSMSVPVTGRSLRETEFREQRLDSRLKELRAKASLRIEMSENMSSRMSENMALQLKSHPFFEQAVLPTQLALQLKSHPFFEQAVLPLHTSPLLLHTSYALGR
jgi:hypothetical protein